MKRTELKRSAPLRRDTGDARLSVPVPVKRKCKGCGGQYLRLRPLQVACGPACAQLLAGLKRARDEQAASRRERAEDRAKKEAIKPRSQWLKEAQAAFNAYIRARDSKLACVSCGRHHQGAWDAGHYLTTGARPELRFDEDNVHRQCVPCNRHLHGNVVLFRAELIRRRGLAVVERLEGPAAPHRYTVDDLREIKRKYAALARALQKENA